ncbi:hypothetical protein DFA_09490 [Cavenderia fasciculata]|uniref:Transmembrane protein n=1 Tax=Cavenderia fasciculata TaxID=261658 RepID=F4Q7S1_CACFS|nr:uncharacterized protein DFA_09490 [Cavenderia fasciculata]EGG15821.1 hypothetical protein DFA_09490 [Cavenderia fasciculata]|eukprot:XP_004352146.1 hypothetical protein DFA_09490 [Cavenderia fasciculata]
MVFCVLTLIRRWSMPQKLLNVRVLAFLYIYPFQTVGYQVREYPFPYNQLILIGTLVINGVWCKMGTFMVIMTLAWKFQRIQFIYRLEKFIRPILTISTFLVSYLYKEKAYYILGPYFFIASQGILFCIQINKMVNNINLEFQAKLNLLPWYVHEKKFIRNPFINNLLNTKSILFMAFNFRSIVFCVINTLVRYWYFPSQERKTIQDKIQSDSWSLWIEMLHLYVTSSVELEWNDILPFIITKFKLSISNFWKHNLHNNNNNVNNNNIFNEMAPPPINNNNNVNDHNNNNNDTNDILKYAQKNLTPTIRQRKIDIIN